MSAPRRTCVGCREVVDAGEVERFVLVDGRLVHDPDRRMDGRGAWLHRRASCVAAARPGFARSFRRSVDVSVLEGWV